MNADPVQLTLRCVQRGREYIARRCPELCVPGIDLAQAISSELALSALANQPHSLVAPDQRDLMPQLAMALPWLAHASVSNLFLPRAWVDRILAAPDLASIESWFRRAPMIALLDAARTQTTIKPPKVGRNEPCPCGSGRKMKRCCGYPEGRAVLARR